MALFQVPLHVRTHRDGSVTVRTLGPREKTLWGLELDAVLEEVQLALWDELERIHPRYLAEFARNVRSELLTITVDDALVPLDPDAAPLPLDLTVVRNVSKGRQALWMPSLDARAWVDAEEDSEAPATALAAELLARLPNASRLDLRAEPEETLRLLEVDATPAPLSAFFGEHAGKERLPVVYDAQHEDDDEDGTAKKKKKRNPTPTLDRIARPMHKLAEEGRLSRAFGRSDELKRLLRILSVAAGPVVLVGPRGVGKSCLVDELVHTLSEAGTPSRLRDKEVWFADAGRLIAGGGLFSDSWQEQIFGMIRDCIAEEVLWCLGDVLPLLDAGKSIFSEQNVAEVLGPVIANGQLRILAESSDTDWAQVELRNPGFARRFTVVRLEDPAEAVLKDILRAVAAGMDDLRIPRGATLAALELAKRYDAGLATIGASVGLLQRVAEAARARGDTEIDRYTVVQHVCDETGLPPFLVRDDVALDLDSVEAHFAGRILGQDAVIGRMTDLVARIKAGVADADRPLGSFLFVGPTGVGKTETVKALAALLFGSDERVLRFDMSEFAGPDCLDRFLGDTASGLVARVARSPFSVVLLDEVEKAHPAIFDLLLQVLGEARLTDRGGRRADFRNSVVLMTSNLGVDTFQRPTGFGSDLGRALDAHLMGEVERHFRPELVNRIDAIVSFAPLGAAPIRAITDRELAKVASREGLRAHRTQLQLDDDVPAWLAARGVDLRYGARPLKRTIERDLVGPLAHHLASLKRPAKAVRVSVEDAGLHVASTEADAETDTSELDELLVRLGRMRRQLDRWRATSRHTVAARKVRTIDRLARGKRFWHDKTEARRLLAEAEPPRQLVEQSDGLRDRIQSLEDLAFEAWAGFLDEDSVVELFVEVDDAASALVDLAWKIDGFDLSHPDAATVFVFDGEDKGAKADLIALYANLGLTQGWEVHARGSRSSTIHEIEADKLPRQAKALARLEEAVAVQLAGPHAYTMLRREVGVIQVCRRQEPVALKVACSSGKQMLCPQLDEPPQIRRVDWSRDVFHNGRLRAQRTTARMHETLADFLRDAMLARHFGHDAIKGMR